MEDLKPKITGTSEGAVGVIDPANSDAVKPNGATEGAVPEDKFVAPFDVNSLPEEQRQIVNEKLKQLENAHNEREKQRDNAYYEKTRKLAEERRITQSEKAEIEKLKAELETIKTDIYEPDTNTANDNLSEEEKRALNIIDTRAREIVSREMQPFNNRMIDEEIAVVSKKHIDFFEYAPKITEYIIRTKDKTTGKNTVSLEEAYHSVKGDISYTQAIAEGKRLAFAELESKKRTSASSIQPSNSSNQVVSGNGSFEENFEKIFNANKK